MSGKAQISGVAHFLGNVSPKRSREWHHARLKTRPRPSTQGLHHYVEQQVSVVSQLEKLRIGVSALGGCIQECLGVLKAWSAKDIANDTEEVNEGDLDLSLAMSTQPHASAPHTKSAREHDCTAPSSSAGTTASVAAAGSMPTTAGRCSNLGSEGATQG